jgi:hypothetical protein
VPETDPQTDPKSANFGGRFGGQFRALFETLPKCPKPALFPGSVFDHKFGLVFTPPLERGGRKPVPKTASKVPGLPPWPGGAKPGVLPVFPGVRG